MYYSKSILIKNILFCSIYFLDFKGSSWLVVDLDKSFAILDVFVEDILGVPKFYSPPANGKRDFWVILFLKI
jgi:hypothetical protein